MKKILVILAVLLVGVVVLCPTPVMALKTDPICKQLVAGSEQWKAAGCDIDPGESVFDKVPGAVMATFFIAGIIAVGVIIFGGVRYAISQGDPGKVKKAKDTLLYAVIGLVVTLMAFAIVTFILDGIS